METKSTILQELSAIAPDLAKGEKIGLAYTVPVSYFETLPATVLALIHEQQVDHSISKELVYAAPEGYFDDFASRILQKIKSSANQQSVTEELTTVAPLLAGLDKSPVYSVPDSYFAQFKPAVNRAKVVQFNFRKVVTYAAAAVVIGFLSIGAWVFQENKYLKKHEASLQIDVPTAFKSLSDEELSLYLRTASTENLISSSVLLENNTNVDLGNNLNILTDEELESYLNEEETNDTHKKS